MTDWRDIGLEIERMSEIVACDIAKAGFGNTFSDIGEKILDYLPFADVDKLPESPGVYIIYDPSTSRVVYVGQSFNIRSRMKSHRYQRHITVDKPNIVYYWEYKEHKSGGYTLGMCEAVFILMLKPRANQVIRTRLFFESQVLRAPV